jgi:hypothetical protein
VLEMVCAFNLCVTLGMQAGPTRPWIAAMPGEAIGYVP